MSGNELINRWATNEDLIRRSPPRLHFHSFGLFVGMVGPSHRIQPKPIQARIIGGTGSGCLPSTMESRLKTVSLIYRAYASSNARLE